MPEPIDDPTPGEETSPTGEIPDVDPDGVWSEEGSVAGDAMLGGREWEDPDDRRTPSKAMVIAGAVVAVLLVVGLSVVVFGGGDDGEGGGGGGGDDAATTLPPAPANEEPFTFTTLTEEGGDPTAALEAGDLDVGAFPATQLPADTYTVLADDREARVAQPIVPVVRADLVFPELEATLAAVSDALEPDDLPGMVAFARGGGAPAELATSWLTDNELLEPAKIEAAGPIRIGAPADVDLQIMAQAYGQELALAGFDVTYEDPYPDSTAALQALAALEVDVVITDLAQASIGAGATGELPADADQAIDAVDEALAQVNGVVLSPTDVDRSTRWAIVPARAEELELADTSDLSGVDEALAFGGADACLADPSCLPLLQTAYNLTFDQ